jgi:hypothetical protein
MSPNIFAKTCRFYLQRIDYSTIQLIQAGLQVTLLFIASLSLLFSEVEGSLAQSVTQAKAAIAQTEIQVVNEKIVLTHQLQTRLASKIHQTRAILYELAQNFSFPYTEEVGIVYTNESRNVWRVQFTFSGLPLTLSEDIMLPTRQVLQLKRIFEQTKSLEIGGKTYATTGFMRQLGPTLHH